MTANVAGAGSGASVGDRAFERGHGGRHPACRRRACRAGRRQGTATLGGVAADLHETVGARLRRVDQRYTAGRRVLVEILAASGRPLSIPEILAERPALPQSTVYRNLAVLEGAGALHRVVGADDFARYELAEDLTEHHHHLVCTACGAVTDWTLSPDVERAVGRAVGEIAASTGFRPERHRLDLLGTCAACHAGGPLEIETHSQ